MKHSPEHANDIYLQLEELDPNFPRVAKILFQCFSKSGKHIQENGYEAYYLEKLIDTSLLKENINRNWFFGVVQQMLENNEAVAHLVAFVDQVHAQHNVRDKRTSEILKTDHNKLRYVVSENTELPLFLRLINLFRVKVLRH